MKFEFSKCHGIWIAASCTLLFFAACKKDKDKDRELRSKEFNLAANGNSGITAKLKITENNTSSFNVLVTLSNSKKDTVHIMKLYHGIPATPGPLALELANITGTGAAVSGTTGNISQIKWTDGTNKTFNYDSIIKYTAFAKVLFSAHQPDSLLCQGKVGKLD